MHRIKSNDIKRFVFKYHTPTIDGVYLHMLYIDKFALGSFSILILIFNACDSIVKDKEREKAHCSNNRIWNLFQGDYIRHPVYELSNKYGVASSDQVPLPARLDELREHIRREIRKVCRVSLILLGTTSLPRSSLFRRTPQYTR